MAKNHRELDEDMMVSADIYHLKNLDSILIPGSTLTLRKILMDITAADPEQTEQAFMLQQVNTTRLGNVRFVFHKSQEKRVNGATPYLFCLITTYRHLITAPYQLSDEGEALFEDALRACFTEVHLSSNIDAVFNPSNGEFTSEADADLEALQRFLESKGKGKGAILLSGAASVTSTISAITGQ